MSEQPIDESLTPPPAPSKSKRTGIVVAQTLDVMLHVLDRDYVDKDMVHGQSQPDGSFVFADVPSDANTQFAVMATYDGVAYFSNTAPANMNTLQYEQRGLSVAEYQEQRQGLLRNAKQLS